MSFGQETSVFELYSQGNLPKKLQISDENKAILFKEELLRGGYLKNVDLTKTVNRSVLNHNLLRNTGQLIFGNKVQGYLDSLVKIICSKIPELNSTEFDVFLTQNPTVNASCYFHKEIHVNLGLLAHLDNEEELTFILCHEISHYFLEHTNRQIHYHQEQKKDDKKRKRRKKKESEKSVSKLLESLKVSKNHELEADSLGVVFMERCGYSSSNAVSALKKLFTSDQSYFQYENVVDSIFSKDEIIPLVFKEHEQINITKNANYFDEFHDHPNIQKRVKAIESLKKINETTTTHSTYFNKIRKACRFAHLKCLFLNKEYSQVLYNATYLIKKHPEFHPELKKWQILSLYSIAKHKNHDLLGTIMLPINKTPGFEQELTSFFKQCSKKQLLGLVIKFIFNESIKSSKNQSLYNNLLDDLFSEINPNSRLKLTALQNPNEEEIQLIQTNPNEISEKEKYEIQIKLRDFWKYNWNQNAVERLKSHHTTKAERKKVKLYPLIFISDVEKRKNLIENLKQYKPKNTDSVSIDLSLSETFFTKPTSLKSINFHKNKFDWILQTSQNEGLFQPLTTQLNIFDFKKENIVIDFVISRPYSVILKGTGHLIIHNFVSVKPNVSSRQKEVREYKKSIKLGKFQKKYEKTILQLN